jgi:hypothetical protein
MDENDSVKREITAETPEASVVPLVTVIDRSLATVVATRDPEQTKREIAVIWVWGSMITIAIQLLMVTLSTFRAQNLLEVRMFLETIYPLMLKFNLSVVCPPVIYVIASYFAKREKDQH